MGNVIRKNSVSRHSKEGHVERPLFKYSPEFRVILPQKQSLIWSRSKGPTKLFIVLYILLTMIIIFAALGHASPPPSRGARSIALGNGYTAVSGDPYSLFYNPGAMSDLNQKELALDYGRSSSVGEHSRSDFNYIYAEPYRYQDKYIPTAVGLYTETPAPGAHVVDLTIGGGSDAPVETWTKGFIKFPVKLGAAVTLRQQQGFAKSDRIAKSKLGLGFTLGSFIPIDRNHQVGVAIRNLFAGKADVDGPSIHAGIVRRHREYLNMFADLEYDSGGIWRVSPGLEWLFSRGVLRPRLGGGFRDNGGIDSVATGLGIYLSPIQIDIAYLIPTKTLTDNMSQFRASLSYRFGNPQFSEVYYDRALEAASKLDQNVLTMKVTEAELKASLAELEQKNKLAKEELTNAKSRIEMLKEKDLLGQRDTRIRQLESRLSQLQQDLANERFETKSLRQKQATIRIHVVKAGDTLQSLSKEYYGDPNQWKKIFNANPDKIERGLPRPGAKLVIP